MTLHWSAALTSTLHWFETELLTPDVHDRKDGDSCSSGWRRV
jgi:hypothetical protein